MLREKRKCRNKNRGFTLSELLLVIAIMGVIALLSTAAVINIQRSTRQKKLDDCARQIYMAAQQQLTTMKYTGRAAEISAAGGEELKYTPSDASATIIDKIENGQVKLCYLDNANSSADTILPSDMIDPELRDGKWVIEYDAKNGNVYAVFYAEDETFFADTENGDVNDKYHVTYNDLRDKADGTSRADFRKGGTHATVGYYGGSSIWEQDAKDLDVSIEIENKEQLQVMLSYKEPSIKNSAGDVTNDPVESIELIVKDLDQDKSWKLTAKVNGKQITTSSNKTGLEDIDFSGLQTDSVTKRNYTVLTLDSMDAKKGFKDITGLDVGDNISITVKVKSKTGIIGDSKVETNSGFAAKKDSEDKNDTEIISVAYGRHLQNLMNYKGNKSAANIDKNIEVVQTKDITFSDTGNGDSWYALYVKKDNASDSLTFKPIINDKIKSFDGKNNVIKGMTINSKEETAGMFATFAGEALQNICMVDTTIIADHATSVGTIVGQTNALTKLENCSAYISNDYAVQLANGVTELQDVQRVVRGGNYTGGLIGCVNGSKELAVKNSFAALSLEGEGYAGGLFGFIKAGKVTVENSYADNYIFADNAAGLGCIESRQKLELSSCYAAGFIQSNGGAAGLVYAENSNANSNLKMKNAYSIVEMPASSSPISNVKDGANSNGTVYYMGNASDSNNQGQPCQDMESAEFLTKLGGNFALNAKTNPYNLMDNGLSDYTFPVLTGLGSEHYGDWRATFNKGLVYYEKYIDEASNKSYGFYGANTSLLKRNNSKLKIVADGYAYVMSKEDYENTDKKISVTFSGNKNIDGAEAQEVNVDNNISVYDEKADATYYLVPLDQLIESKMQTLQDSFYYMIKIGNNSYYFNPYFARTVKSINAESSEDASNLKVGTVYISTARQLNNLSRYNNYWNWSGASYLQDYNIDYTSYKGYSEVISGANTNTGYNYSNILKKSIFNLSSDNQAVQNPIGTRNIPFTRVYDGGENTIKGVTFAANATSKESTAIGLFGYNNGVVKNITLDGNGARSYAYGFTQSNINFSKTYVYMGALVGYNAGQVENSAVTAYMPASNLKSGSYNNTIKTYNNSTLYIGGAIGYNNGYANKVTVDVPNIHVESTSAYVYGGAFTGGNSGLISGAYGFGRIYGTLDTNLNASYGGFAGYNQGTIQNAYCGTSIVVAGRAQKYAFTDNKNITTNCYYLNNLDGTYYKKVYAYSAKTQTEAGITELKSFANLNQASIPGFSSANETTIQTTKTNGSTFPYPAIIKRKGKIVSVGNWPIDAELGEAGVVYWEVEEGGNNPGLYFSTLDERGNRNSTLCTQHDDGGEVTSYGYGYYYTTENGGTPDWELSDYNYLNMETAEENDSISKQLNAAMPTFQFKVYTSGEDNGQLKKLQLTSGGRYQEVSQWEKDEPKTSSSVFKLDVNGSWENCTKEQYDEASRVNSACVKTNNNLNGEFSEKEGVESSGEYTGNNKFYYSSYYSWNYKEIEFDYNETDINSGLIVSKTAMGENNNYSDYKFALQKVKKGDHDTVLDVKKQTSTNGNISIDSEDTTYWKFGYVDAANKWTSLTATNSGQRLSYTSGSFLGIPSYEYSYYYKHSNNSTVNMQLTITTKYKKWDYQRKGEWGHYETVKVLVADNTYAPNGSITLKSTKANMSYDFIINPFFGDSMARASSQDPNNGETVDTLGNGTKSNYSIRNLQQMQFINWNCNTKTACKDYTNTDEKTEYQYNIYLLRYNQSAAVVSECKGNLKGKFNWNQTHDIGREQVTKFYPLGGLIDYGTTKDASAVIAAFGGTYDGQDYVVKNVRITSKAQCVGLFGVVMGGNLSHIVMNATTDPTILEDNKLAVVETDSRGGNWYCLGGLVGFAAKGPTSLSGTTTISNCSSSGYIVRDNRANHGYGGAGVGGLVGINNMNLTNCSAINNIILNFSYSNKDRNVRTGGIAGTCRGEVKNCYAGGAISITNAAVNSTHIYIGGLTGATFIKDNGNLEKLVGLSSNKSVIKNSYSYVSLPTKTSNVSAMTVFANGGDGNGSTDVSNCYYLDGTQGAASAVTASKMTYEQMADTTGSNGLYNKLHTADNQWGLVSVSESNGTGSESDVTVNGKYSFNSSSDLNGKNYPFPTILRQVSNGVTYNVHYGDWPTNGIKVPDKLEIDLLSDRNNAGDAVGQLTAKLTGVDTSTQGTFNVESDDDTIATATVQKENNAEYTINVQAKDIGTVTLTLTYQKQGGYKYTAYVTVSVTAVIEIQAPDKIQINAGAEIPLSADKLQALDSNKKVLADGKWHVSTLSNDIVINNPRTDSPSVAANQMVENGGAGITVEYTYSAKGKDFTATKTIGVTIIPAEEITTDGIDVLRSAVDPVTKTLAEIFSDISVDGYVWSYKVFTEAGKETEDLLNVSLDENTISLSAVEETSSTLPDKTAYVQIFGLGKNGEKSVYTMIPVQIKNMADTQQGMDETTGEQPDEDDQPAGISTQAIDEGGEDN